MRTTRIVLVALACMALGTAGCGGGGTEPSAGPVTPPTTATNPGSSSGPAPGAGAAVGTFRACHKHRNGSLVLIMLFENRDRSLVGGFAGALAFGVEASEPATWTTTGDPVTVDPGINEHVRQITVPSGEPAPSEVTLSVTNVLATNPVTIPVPASACSSA
jgi:hypothetical protein